MSKIKAVCNSCKFGLTSGDATVGDVCPWCKRGILQEPETNKQSSTNQHILETRGEEE